MIEYKSQVLDEQEFEQIQKDFALASTMANREDHDGSQKDKKSGKSWFIDKSMCKMITPSISNLCEKLKVTNNYSVLYGEYENNDFYMSHKDDSVKTLVYFYRNLSDNFDGGELRVNDKIFKHQNNDSVIFNGDYEHEVKTVKIKTGSRKTLTIFYY